MMCDTIEETACPLVHAREDLYQRHLQVKRRTGAVAVALGTKDTAIKGIKATS